MSDRTPSLPPPPQNLKGFPTSTLKLRATVARSHSVDFGPWWFSSTPEKGGGRFDLVSPMGTCYVADSVEAAVRERLRDGILQHRVVTMKMADSFAVSLFCVPQPFRCANIAHDKAALFGVTRELESLTPTDYPKSREWAEALLTAGFQGIRYGARFTPGKANAWALFGRAGDVEPGPEVITALSGRQACRRAGLSVIGPPKDSLLQPDPRVSVGESDHAGLLGKSGRFARASERVGEVSSTTMVAGSGDDQIPEN